MCGRFTLNLSSEDLQRLFALSEAPEWKPRWNLAPGQDLPTLVAAGDGLALEKAYWGLLPSWAKPSMRPMINARAETVAEKPSFRSAFRQRRCLVPASGFYEWQKTPAGKVPYWIHRPGGRPFVIAAIWQPRAPEARPGDRSAAGAEAGSGRSFALLTTAANADVEPIHHRMPVILRHKDYARWLDPGQACAALLQSPAAGLLQAHPVSSQVNRVRFDQPECIEPLANDGGLFEDHQ